MDITIKYCDEDDPTQLYEHYVGREGPQEVELLLDIQSGLLWMRFNPEIGTGRPERHFHGLVRCWVLDFVPTSEQANEILDEVSEEAERVYQGSWVEREDVDFVGRLTGPGEEASEAIEKILEDLRAQPLVGIVETIDVYDLTGGKDLVDLLEEEGITVDADTTDAELDQIALDLTAEGEDGTNCLIVRGLLGALFDIRDEAEGESD